MTTPENDSKTTITAAELRQKFAGVFIWNTWGIPTLSEESHSVTDCGHTEHN